MIDDQKVETNINRTAGAAKQLRLSRSLFRKLAGREGFEPSIPDPKSGALPLGDRPSPTTYGTHLFTDSLLRRAFDFLILSNNLVLEHLSCLVVDWMRDVFIGSVFPLLAGH